MQVASRLNCAVRLQLLLGASSSVFDATDDLRSSLAKLKVAAASMKNNALEHLACISLHDSHYYRAIRDLHLHIRDGWIAMCRDCCTASVAFPVAFDDFTPHTRSHPFRRKGSSWAGNPAVR